jgi:hypothetical protein
MSVLYAKGALPLARLYLGTLAVAATCPMQNANARSIARDPVCSDFGLSELKRGKMVSEFYHILYFSS